MIDTTYDQILRSTHLEMHVMRTKCFGSPRVSRTVVLLSAAVAIATAGCHRQPQGKTKPVEQATRPNVFAVNYPLAYFAERIGGETINVTLPVPSDLNPAWWEPDGDAIAAFQSADLILLNGADYAKWTLRATLPWSRTVITTRDVEDHYIEVPDAIVHSHGPEGEHSHAVLASETWLDPQLAIAQARVIRQELEELVPAAADDFKLNFDLLVRDLEKLDQELKSVFAATDGWSAADPAFSYIGRRYQLAMPILSLQQDEPATDQQWQNLEPILASQTVSRLLWSEEPQAATADRLRAMGMRSIVFRIAAQPPESGDFLSVMRENVEQLRNAIAENPPKHDRQKSLIDK
jgi:zinc transport system substrate-binding protein